MFQTKFVEKIKTHFMFNNSPPRENRAVYEIMCKNIVEPDRPHIIWRISVACCIPKATETYSEFVILLLHGNNGEANASQCYIIFPLPVLSRLYITSGSSCGDRHKFFRPPFVFVHPPLALVGN